MAQVKELTIARNSPTPASTQIDTLEVNFKLMVKGLTAKKVRVELPDGSSAYLPGEGLDLEN
jgi:hypothetical protein